MVNLPNSHPWRNTEEFARQLDADDPLSRLREDFHIPRRPDGSEVSYFCGHSLGLQPRMARALVEEELDQWAALGVEGHFAGAAPWYSYHELLREPTARLVGARPSEVVVMNSLTVNLHLMLTTFYRPHGTRCKILIDTPTFPSDLYAVQSQIQYHGHDPGQALLMLHPRSAEGCLRTEDILAFLDSRGEEIAVVLLSGVNFVSGQFYDLPTITAAAHRKGCCVGWDLAHAAGNVVLQLHDWEIDFAVWCSYKYLNGGPGAVAGCFVHERHGHNLALPRYAGWWGNDPATRFRMQLEDRFIPRPGADGWQLSNPPILALAPLRAAMALFETVGMPTLRTRSERLTGYLEALVEELPAGEMLTPRDPAARGSQLSLRIPGKARALTERLAERGILVDFREPDVIRLAPVPLYNRFHDVWRAAQALRDLLTD